MLRWQILLLSVIAIFAVQVPCYAQSTAAPAATPEAARLKGIAYIKSEQFDDGSWEFEGHDVGITSLCALALIENGMAVSDPVIDKAHRFVQKESTEVKATYDIALAILFLSRVGDRDNRTKIRDLAARLIAGQTVEGGWGYTCPLANAGILSNPKDKPKLQPGVGDNSCTQFAVLGLWVSSRWGVDISKTMSLVGERFIETQREDGGWPYACEEWTKMVATSGSTKPESTAEIDPNAPKKKKPKEKPAVKPPVDPAVPAPAGTTEVVLQPSSPTMTFAGLFCLTVARATVIREERDKARTTGKPGTPANSAAGNEGNTLMADPSFADGLKRAGEFAATLSAGSARYFMWSVERMGVVLGMEKFGGTEWFSQGAAALVASQEANGSWKNPSEAQGSLADTSFAVLFLRKANLGSDISRLLNGEPADRFQITSQEKRPRFNTFEDALKAAKPGDRIRVDGVGPFLMPHLEITQDLTIEAGFGYQPVFRYDVGHDKDGRRSRPQDNHETAHMIRVSQGTLTLEGIELQMDPPELGPGIPWAAIVLKGGALRLLNSSISEDGKQGMAGLRFIAPSKAVLQNCQIVGGRAGVEFLASGEQSVTLDNCVVFSNTGFKVLDGPVAGAGKCQLSLNRSVVLTTDAFDCRGLTSSLDIVSNGVAYQCASMGSHMLTAPAGHKGLSWTGGENIYDLKGWVGSAGKPVTAIKDPKTWGTFWGGSDATSSARAIAFTGKRQVGGFNHAVKGEDFEFMAQSAVAAYRRKTGIDPLIVGTGTAFLRFRESFDYRNWISNVAAEAGK